MDYDVCTLDDSKVSLWDSYAKSHPKGTLYHHSGWKKVIEGAYGHRGCYLLAMKKCPARPFEDMIGEQNCEKTVEGILPLIHMKHVLFGDHLVSLPFLDFAGVLANSQDAERALILKAMERCVELKADSIELRQTEPLSWLDNGWASVLGSDHKFHHNRPSLSSLNEQASSCNPFSRCRDHKVRMVLSLPATSENLMQSFKAKLRSQIRKPINEGLTAAVGGGELLDDFYKVFTVNMRDLGSPVHSKEFIAHVLAAHPETSKIMLVYKGDLPLACGLVLGFGDMLENPWASSLRDYTRLSPNMLLYWTMLKYACQNGFRYFDFGRSSPDAGSYRFKEQWGAKPQRLYWRYIWMDGRSHADPVSKNSNLQIAARVWKRLPLSLTKWVGPRIRKHISL